MDKDKYSPFWRGYYTEQNSQGQIIHQKFTFSSFHIQIVDAQKTIKAIGKDQHGECTLTGYISKEDDKTFNGTFKSTNKEIIVKANLYYQNILSGTWQPFDQNYPQGHFTVNQETIKQGWNGDFIQNGIPFRMSFHQLTIEPVPQGKVQGKGEDWCGPFIMNGHFSTASNEVTFIKQYINGTNGEACWVYWGTLCNQEVKGHWGMEKGKPMGQFILNYVD